MPWSARSAQIPFKMQSRCDLMTRDTVRGAAPRRLRRSLDGRRIRLAAGAGRDGQGHQRRTESIAARENLRRHGIRACFFLQFGYPGEEWDEIEETIRMVRETQPDDIGVSVSYPLPGTRFLSDLVASQLGRKTNWSDSDDLAMMFQGAYPSEFYRALADALHLEVRQQADGAALQDAWRASRRARAAGQCWRKVTC